LAASPDNLSKSKSLSDTPQTDRFVRLLTQHERRIYAYILSLVPRWADADEIQQETNVRLWEQFSEFDPSADFGAWACTIAHYQVLTFRKRAQREKRHFSEHFLELVRQESQSQADELADRLAAMESCLDKLLPNQRNLLKQVYNGKTTIKQIAQSLGRPIAGTYKTLARIREILHECIDRQLSREVDS
jgi:RNA polymerase sigma-70 factor (ECF subfamily)